MVGRVRRERVRRFAPDGVFEDLGEPEDWSVTHQKPALAHRGAGELSQALHCIDIGRTTGTVVGGTAPPPAPASHAARPSTTGGTHALCLGVPDEAIVVEAEAVNTGQNIGFSRELLAEAGIAVESVLLISKPYMQRRVGRVGD